MDRKQLNVRIPADLYNLLEEQEDKKQNIVTDALKLYFASKTYQNIDKENDDNKLLQALQEEVAYLRSKLDDANKRIDDALKLLHQEQILHLQSQRQLIEPEKKWWKFWK